MTKLLCLTGPTASGKSAVALQLARNLSLDIISSDSMQIYKYMDIGTAKPRIEEQELVKHHMIDIVEPNESYSGFDYKQGVNSIIESSKRDTFLLAGGTGFYIESVLYPLDFSADDNTKSIRAEMKQLYDKFGRDALYEKLVELDPKSAENIHPNNIVRVIRAIEIALSGEKKSERTRTRESEFEYAVFSLAMERNVLYDRINRRVDEMVKEGLIEEVEFVYKKYRDRNLQSLQAIGYKEIIDYIEGATSKDEAIELVKQHSRNYAKRQETFNKRLNPNYIDASQSVEKIAFEIIAYFVSIL